MAVLCVRRRVTPKGVHVSKAQTWAVHAFPRQWAGLLRQDSAGIERAEAV